MARAVPKDQLKKIIHDGDAEVLVNAASEFGLALAQDRLSKSQIRNVFGEVRNIEAAWSEPDDNAPSNSAANSAQNLRKLLLLKPRMAYQGKREPKAQPLMTTLTDAIDLVVAERTKLPLTALYGRFKHFTEFFEAILAYHTAGGGK